MHRKDIDWRIIRGAIISLVLSSVITGSLVAGSYYFEDAMNREYIRNNAQFKNISQRYLAIDEEAKRIQKYLPEFIDLYNRGVIGSEQRLNWIEVLQNAGARIKIPSLSYSISSQKDYTPPYSISLGSYKLYKSEMSLEIQLLHEGDLFSLLSTLNNEARGEFNLTSCNLDKGRNDIVESAKAANIRASCELEWYTIKLASGKEIKI